MNRITITVPEELDERLEGLVEDGEYESKSEAVRGLIGERDTSVSEYEGRMREYDRRVSEYEERIDELKTERDRLERKLTAANDPQDDVGELVEYVETEKTLSERKAHAGITTRAKWWLFGMPEDE